jgi:hypothetical protein
MGGEVGVIQRIIDDCAIETACTEDGREEREGADNN